MCFYCFIDSLHKNDEILKCLCAHTYRYPVLTEIHCYGRLSTYPLPHAESSHTQRERELAALDLQLKPHCPLQVGRGFI